MAADKQKASFIERLSTEKEKNKQMTAFDELAYCSRATTNHAAMEQEFSYLYWVLT